MIAVLPTVVHIRLRPPDKEGEFVSPPDFGQADRSTLFGERKVATPKTSLNADVSRVKILGSAEKVKEGQVDRCPLQQPFYRGESLPPGETSTTAGSPESQGGVCMSLVPYLLQSCQGKKNLRETRGGVGSPEVR